MSMVPGMPIAADRRRFPPFVHFDWSILTYTGYIPGDMSLLSGQESTPSNQGFQKASA